MSYCAVRGLKVATAVVVVIIACFLFISWLVLFVVVAIVVVVVLVCDQSESTMESMNREQALPSFGSTGWLIKRQMQSVWGYWLLALRKKHLFLLL